MKTEECWWCGNCIEPDQVRIVSIIDGKEERFCDEDCIEEAKQMYRSAQNQENGA